MSTRVTLQERRKALEEEFFKKEERRKVEELREKVARDQSIDELKALSGIGDELVLGDLVDADVGADTLLAFALVPLVAVAWASGSVKDTERDAVLRAAHESEILEGTPAYETLERMLQSKPGHRLLTAWKGYAGSLHASLGDTEQARLESDVNRRAREVAEAAGGFLGLGAVSPAEEAVLEEIASAFR